MYNRNSLQLELPLAFKAAAQSSIKMISSSAVQQAYLPYSHKIVTQSIGVIFVSTECNRATRMTEE